MSNKIVVGVDGSSTGQRALDWATADAVRRHSALVVVCAWSIPALAYSAPEAALLIDPEELAAAAAETIQRHLDSTDLTGLSQPPQALVRNGPAGDAILSAAEDADLIVVGSRGRGELTELFLGSVSQHVLHHTHVPVVVVPASL